MSLKVVGAGVGRTATYSLKLALEQLGFGLMLRLGRAWVWWHPAKAERILGIKDDAQEIGTSAHPTPATAEEVCA